jgi:hypothetical protein
MFPAVATFPAAEDIAPAQGRAHWGESHVMECKMCVEQQTGEMKKLGTQELLENV